MGWKFEIQSFCLNFNTYNKIILKFSKKKFHKKKLNFGKYSLLVKVLALQIEEFCF